MPLRTSDGARRLVEFESLCDYPVEVELSDPLSAGRSYRGWPGWGRSDWPRTRGRFDPRLAQGRLKDWFLAMNPQVPYRQWQAELRRLLAYWSSRGCTLPANYLRQLEDWIRECQSLAARREALLATKHDRPTQPAPSTVTISVSNASGNAATAIPTRRTVRIPPEMLSAVRVDLRRPSSTGEVSTAQSTVTRVALMTATDVADTKTAERVPLQPTGTSTSERAAAMEEAFGRSQETTHGERAQQDVDGDVSILANRKREPIGNPRSSSPAGSAHIPAEALEALDGGRMGKVSLQFVTQVLVIARATEPGLSGLALETTAESFNVIVKTMEDAREDRTILGRVDHSAVAPVVGNAIAPTWLVQRFATTPLGRDLLTHYREASGRVFFLNEDQMKQVNPVNLDLTLASGFGGVLATWKAAAQRSGEVESGEAAFEQHGVKPGSAATLGRFLATYHGMLSVSPDGTWAFRGDVGFHNFFDFDRRLDRPPEAEFQAEQIRKWFFGRGFPVQSQRMPFAQSSKTGPTWAGSNTSYPQTLTYTRRIYEQMRRAQRRSGRE